MSRDIDQTAVTWAVRLDADNLTGEEHERLEQWLAADARHRGALLRARAGLTLLDMDRDTDRIRRDVASSPAVMAAGSPAPRRVGRWSIGIISACAAAAAAAVWVIIPPGQRIDTQSREVRRIALEDGSVALINARSAITVDYEEDSRLIRVRQGEAWFQVAHNATRPFVVTAGSVHVRATGTAFAVRKGSDGNVRIVVTEGTVDVSRDGSTRHLNVDAGNQASIATTDEPKPALVQVVGTAHPLAWREGGLELDGMSVGEAVVEFNRYNIRQIAIADRAIDGAQMIGYFKLDNPDQFADAVARVTGANVSRNGSKIVIGLK